MRTVDEIKDLQGKTVFLRADFDVPLLRQGFGGQAIIAEEYRIARQRENLQYLLDRGARVVIGAHITAVPLLEPLRPQLERMLGVTFGDQVKLLENLRANSGEEANDPAFARELVKGCDFYVNNAFAVCHRTHASVAIAPTLLPSYAGLLLQEEVQQLADVLDAPSAGKIIYMGGAKASTKVPVIKHLIAGAEAICVGGVLANDIFKALGRDMTGSQVDDNAVELLAGLDLTDTRLKLPTDDKRDNGRISDMGPESATAFGKLAETARLIVWNGPMGRFEDERFAAGTKTLAKAIAASGARKIIGGGDTIAAVDRWGLLDKMGFVSTGGGAMLAFLAGERLPGLEALDYHVR